LVLALSLRRRAPLLVNLNFLGAEKIELLRRRNNLSWSHHREVAAFPAPFVIVKLPAQVGRIFRQRSPK
jgi:hypothetical protein